MFYLRKVYQQNLLMQPGGLSLAGVPIDLSKVTTPAYIVATKEDHIAPWRSCYPGTQVLAGPRRFVLGASGHIAGIVNPPAAGKYAYWTNTRPARGPGCVAGGRHTARRLLVARLGALAGAPSRQEGAGPPARRRQARAARGRARLLRQGPRERVGLDCNRCAQRPLWSEHHSRNAARWPGSRCARPLAPSLFQASRRQRRSEATLEPELAGSRSSPDEVDHLGDAANRDCRRAVSVCAARPRRLPVSRPGILGARRPGCWG